MMLEHALTYARRGWPVFPCHSVMDGLCSCGKPDCSNPGKHPRTRNGLHEATTDLEQIRIWWEMWPGANIAFAPPANLVIVDVDIKHDQGKFGDETLTGYVDEHGELPQTVISLTGGGGVQYFFTTAKPMKNGTGLLPSVDVRTAGGYVILPPSTHRSGRRYEWEASSEPDGTPMAPIPDALYALLTAQKQRAPRGTPETIPEGARNDTLFRIACSLRARGMSELEILGALTPMNKGRCKPPLGDRELQAIARSAAEYEAGELPRPTVTFTGESVKPSDFSDTGNAYIFAQVYRGRAIYVKSIGWLVWNGTVWVDGELEATELAVKLTDRMLAEARFEVKTAGDAHTAATVDEDAEAKKKAHLQKKAAEEYRTHARNTRIKARTAAMLDLARHMLQVKPDMLDANPYLLNTPGGMVDLKTKQILPHDPKEFCTKITSCSPGKKGMRMWADFLNTISSADPQTVNFLQQIAGMAAVGKVFEENLIIALGDGKNGKSACFNSLARVFNNYAGTIAAEVLTTAGKSKGAELATLKGKRLVIAAELEEGMRLSVSLLKQLTSTDRIHAERKYKDPEDFIPSHSTILYTNYTPRVGSSDSGTWRRLVLVPFEAKIPAAIEVKNYADMLAREAGEAILSWIIEGAANYIAQGHKLIIPELVAEATEKYQEANDWLTHFLDECCEIGPGKTVGGAQLYSAFREWATTTGEYVRRAGDFNAEMEKRSFAQHRLNKGRVWYGIGLPYRNYFTGSAG